MDKNSTKQIFQEKDQNRKAEIKKIKKNLKVWFKKPLNSEDFNLEKEQEKLNEIKYRLAVKWYDFIPIFGLFSYYISKVFSFFIQTPGLRNEIRKNSSIKYTKNYLKMKKNIFSYNFHKVEKIFIILYLFIIPAFIYFFLVMIFPWLFWVMFQIVIYKSQKDLDKLKMQKK